jgi:hypothetical protein
MEMYAVSERHDDIASVAKVVMSALTVRRLYTVHMAAFVFL